METKDVFSGVTVQCQIIVPKMENDLNCSNIACCEKIQRTAQLPFKGKGLQKFQPTKIFAYLIKSAKQMLRTRLPLLNVKLPAHEDGGK